MKTMTKDEWHAFVTEGTRTGKVAVTRKNGAPHVTPVWFVLDGDDLLFNTALEGVKGRALARDPRVSIAVDDQEPPFSFVMIDGKAEIITDMDEMLRWAVAIGARYMGKEKGEEFGKRNAVPSECLVRVHVTKVVAQSDLTA
ncbi:PPOX class F420-dependent oxidoreductase [Actinomadura rupiterrae]|uniref:PPOX class F420-dependent oxidoreductase n=1 Tax=Actinomadura rupiterrae TaxID=559627 RepID=UPI0020A477A8|nr:PPOX class F420-dependent oxidoreductase [Actinomadura rupiterrae]MCP2341800.1 hypothetical protein [Actinomadura rupiterrae]MCP2343594.1 hypothetical protein [Actinomadura rupiterrae]